MSRSVLNSPRAVRRTGLLATSALCALFVFAPRQARADDSCTTAANVSSKVWEETPGAVKTAIANTGPFGASAIKAVKLLDEGIKLWNKISGKNSWAKIGQREMRFDTWHEGTLFGSTERMFVSNIPAVDPVRIKFHKLDHGGKVKVVVCKFPKTGKPIVADSFTVQPDAKKGLVKTVKVDDAKGYVIGVVLHGKSFSNKLKYKVKAKFIYPEDPEASDVKVYTGDRGGDGTTYTAPRDEPGTTKVSGKR